MNLSTGITSEQLRAPYGQARYEASATGSSGGMRTPFGFTGQREDTSPAGSSGLDDFNARMYDAETGRFTSADDAQPGLGDPSGQDNYAYVGGMVENATDPSGHAYAPDELGEQGEQGGKIGTKAGGDDGDGNDGSRAGDRPPTISSSTAAYVTLIILGFVAGMVIGALLVEHQDQAAGVINQQTAHAVAIANAVTPPSDDVAPINRKTKIPSPPPPPPTGSGTPTTGTTTETPTQTGGGGSGQLPPIVTASGCGCEWLYRGLGSQDDPSAGLYPRNPGNRVDVFKHVREASRAAYPGDQFISLTKSEVVASVKYGRLGVVRIDPSMVVGNLIDLSTSSGRLAAGIPPDAPAWNWARADAEVLLDGYIPPEAITPFTGDLWSSQEEC